MMTANNPFSNIEKYHPKAQFHLREAQFLIQDVANRMGITPMAYIERAKILRKKEEENRRDAIDPNKNKFMSPEKRSQKLNAYKNRRFLELGVGHVPGEP